jgi:hypothetical protein
MASRYPIVRLPRWTAGQDLVAFLQAYERACPLRLASRLSDLQLMRALLDETDGITDSIVRSLQAAALVAIREGTERIIPEYLCWWRDPPLLTHYGAGDDELDGAELAMAWLRDHRRDVQPAVKAPAPRFLNRAKLSTEPKSCDGPL